MNTKTVWKVSIHEQSVCDYTWLQQNRPDTIDCIKMHLKKLAECPDPRRHSRVKSLCGESKGWFRYAVYECNLRIIFRLLAKGERGVIQVRFDADIDNNEEKYLQITRIGHRAIVYNEKLNTRKALIEAEDDF